MIADPLSHVRGALRLHVRLQLPIAFSAATMAATIIQRFMTMLLVQVPHQAACGAGACAHQRASSGDGLETRRGPGLPGRARDPSGEALDPAALRRIDWELAPFYCPDCAQNYCRADWRTYVLFDEGFYDCTMGRCPRGHEHMIDD